MSESRARALIAHATVTKMCGAATLRVAPPRSRHAGPFSGLGIAIAKGKVVQMHLFSPRLRITCPKGGGFEMNT